MISALGIAASGMRDACVRLDVTANNIANVNTPGFVPSQVVSAEVPQGGVAPVATVGAPGLADPTLASGTDLATEMVDLVVARIAFSTNARVFGAAADLYRTLFDLVG
jgi:flagellar hook protein FlgE